MKIRDVAGNRALMAAARVRQKFSREERDRARRELGRQQAQARGLRQAAARDGVAPDPSWRPAPPRRPVRVFQQDYELRLARAPAAGDTGRAAALRRASEQDLARRQGRPPR